MFAKPKNWLGGGIWRPKNPHSLEHLKYLYTILCKYQAVTEQNRALLVESLRSISEILIWGDQNDSSVFDFFLEKNMLSFFLRFMRQKSGKHLCVQLLQTLNILFENISNETSVYYLLSNNHINAIIVHDFNFSDEEVMAYYISFLKTLSFKLNKHTVHFFYNEHTNDFALYTEAIKFFNHSETMVRIAVRTITLNVYKACCFNCKPDTRGQSLVDEKSMLMYIRDKTAAPYFSNLVWFIGNHVLKIDSCVRHDIDHNSRDRLSDIVAEHLDHLHYLNDILCLQIDALNEVLTDNFLNRLLIPLYVYSLTKRKKYASRMDTRPHVSSVVALFLLSQVFLIISHAPLVRQLADIIFNGDVSVCMGEQPKGSPLRGQRHRGFVKPEEPLAETLQSNRGSSYPVRRPNYRNVDEEEHEETAEATAKDFITTEVASKATSDEIESETQSELLSPNQNSTDEEKLLQSAGAATHIPHGDFSLEKRPYLEAIFIALECTENDYETLFSLCILYALGHNQGINQELLDSVLIPTEKSEAKGHYNISLVEKLIQIISLSCQHGSKVRLATLEMSVLMLKTMIYKEGQCFLQDGHLAAVEGSREEATLLLRNFYKVWEKSEEIFLDMFEDEYREMQTRPLNVEYLTMDASILLPPTGTPLTGIEFNKRLPCGEVERARRAIRVFFLLRDLSLTLRQEPETQLPLTRQDECVNVDDVLDLNNSDLIACTVISRENRRERRFLVIDVLQMILVEPDSRRLGWGVVRFVGFLQDVEVTGDKDDSRSLHITIHKPFMNVHAHPVPLLSARFIFDDHIRCMAAKQRLSKGRLKARQRKMQMIARMLELPSHIVDSMYQPGGYSGSAASLRTASSQGAIPGRSHPVLQRSRGELGHPGRVQSEIVLNRSVFASVDQSQAFSAARQQHRVQQQGRPQPGRSSSGRSSSRPVAIRQSPGGVMRKRSRQERVLHGQDKVADVEEAEEAQPSPEAHACQNLKQPSTQSDTRHRPTTPEPAPPCQDIPLEDLSNQQSSPQTQHGRSKTVRPKSLRGAKVRSSSNSPRRGRSSSASSCSSGGSLSSSSSDSSRSRSETRVKYPGTEASASCPSHRKASPTSAKNVTSFMKVKTDQGNELSQEKNLDHSSGRKRSCADHSGESCGPKSLTPAQEPAVSLLPENELSSLAIADVVVGSPKLLPPVDPTRIRSVSDTSSSSQSESELCITEDSTSAPGDKPPFQTSPRSDLPLVGENQTVADLSNIERTREESAADQLTKLAQMVTEHYGHQDGQQRQTGRQNLALSSTTGDNIEHEESGKH